MSNVRWQRDCFVVPPRSDVIARTRNEEEAISKRHYIYDMTLASFNLKKRIVQTQSVRIPVSRRRIKDVCVAGLRSFLADITSFYSH